MWALQSTRVWLECWSLSRRLLDVLPGRTPSSREKESYSFIRSGFQRPMLESPLNRHWLGYCIVSPGFSFFPILSFIDTYPYPFLLFTETSRNKKIPLLGTCLHFCCLPMFLSSPLIPSSQRLMLTTVWGGMMTTIDDSNRERIFTR